MSHSKLFLLTSAIADIDSALQQSTLLPLHKIGCAALQHPPPRTKYYVDKRNYKQSRSNNWQIVISPLIRSKISRK